MDKALATVEYVLHCSRNMVLCLCMGSNFLLDCDVYRKDDTTTLGLVYKATAIALVNQNPELIVLTYKHRDDVYKLLTFIVKHYLNLPISPEDPAGSKIITHLFERYAFFQGT